jgi:hypothetical protein
MFLSWEFMVALSAKLFLIACLEIDKKDYMFSSNKSSIHPHFAWKMLAGSQPKTSKGV